MNISDLTRFMVRLLEVLGQAISRPICMSFRGCARGLPSPYAIFCWALIVSISLLMLSGCGRYKEELESAKQQIEKLNSDVKRLTEEIASLNQEKDRLRNDLKTLSDKNIQIHRELDGQNKANQALSEENKEMRKRNSIAEEEVASLKREKAHLTQEVEEIKKRDETVHSQKSPGAMPPLGRPPSEQQLEKLSPCDAVLAFMRASEAIVRQQKGTERTKSLEQVKQQYAQRMKGAPERAIKAAENWVKDLSMAWDQVTDYSTLRLIESRNIVLEACGKSPRDTGF